MEADYSFPPSFIIHHSSLTASAEASAKADHSSSMHQEPPVYDHMQATAAFLREKGIDTVDLGMILGSGLSAIADELKNMVEIPYREIPHMPLSGAPGHAGVLRYGTLRGKHVLVFSGRLHYYEGYPMWQVTYPVRIMQALGVKQLLITAAVGGLSDDLEAGDIVLLTDHISLMPENPLRGLTDERLGERFPDLSQVYDDKWSETIREEVASHGFRVRSGVYAGLPGPSLETQSECHMLRVMGADVVGMSVVPEVIVACQAGMRVAAFCVVANMAWHPQTREVTSAEEILRVAGMTSHLLLNVILDCSLHTF